MELKQLKVCMDQKHPSDLVWVSHYIKMCLSSLHHLKWPRYFSNHTRIPYTKFHSIDVQIVLITSVMDDSNNSSASRPAISSDRMTWLLKPVQNTDYLCHHCTRLNGEKETTSQSSSSVDLAEPAAMWNKRCPTQGNL